MTRLEANLVETGWLAAEIGAPDLRILDCTVFLRPAADGRAGYTAESGLARWEKSHIPGSAFADLPGELSDPDSKLRFMLPPAGQFAGAMSRYGVGPGTRVVCYDANMNMWAARVWWMLKTFGFEDAAVLNGGWKKWTAEGRPTSSEAANHPPGGFDARFEAARMATMEEVLAAMADGQTCILNSLTPEQHRGEVAPYGRPGRIPGSVNVSSIGAIDPETGAYRPLGDLRREFDDAGATKSSRVITYCGGGIAASSGALLLTLLGHTDVAVYDASLSEWAADPSLPLEVG